jgi:hypothetical protein
MIREEPSLMSFIARTTVVLGCATALAVLPALTASPSFLPDLGQHAFAKGPGGGGEPGGGNGHGGGHGGGNGHGGGHGAGNSGGQGAGHSASSAPGRGGGQAISAARSGRDGNGSKGGGRGGAAKGVADFIGGIFGGGRGNGKTKGEYAESRRGTSAGKTASAGRGVGKRSLATQQEAALKGKAVPVPALKEEARAKNLHSKLGGLNSLQRNYQAYLNAKDPKFAAIQAYVMTAAQSEMTEAELAAAIEAQAALQAEIATLETRMAQLQEIPEADRTTDEVAELEALAAALTEAQTALADADQAVADLEATLAEQEAAITDEALTAALQAGANPNQVVDQEMVDWAKDVLGVGDAYGKIDQVGDALQADGAVTDPDSGGTTEEVTETDGATDELTETDTDETTNLVQAAE